MRKAVGLSIVVCLCAVVAGCGYTYANSRLSDEYASVAVLAFKNKSFEPDIQILVTNLLIRELQADGRFRLVDDPRSADLVLGGSITGFDAGAISFSTDDDIGQFRIMIVASASLEDRRAGRTIWKKDNLRGTDFYETLGGRTREKALEEAAENLVETLIYECFDGYW